MIRRALTDLSCMLCAILVAAAIAPTLALPWPGQLAESLNDLPSDSSTMVDISTYIKEGRLHEARNATKVRLPSDDGVESFAGFATTSKTPNGDSTQKMFFWYFPAQDGNESAPLIIWLQGGPGGSSLFGLFSEMGPWSLDKELNLIPRPYTWNKRYKMLFIDNPVGAGFSFPSADTGYCTNTKQCVAANLYSLMAQFYQVFDDVLSCELYITGESYGGHYVPAFGAYIDARNAEQPQVHMPLKGVAIGDGWIDPVNMVPGYPEMMFNLGLADVKQRAVIEAYCNKTVAFIEAGQFEAAFNVWDEMLNGDVYPYPNYFHNITGLNDYDNFYNTNAPEEFGYYARFVNQPAVRAALHVGNATFNNGHACERHLLADFHVSLRDELVRLLDSAAGYRVVIYSGHLDVIIGTALTARFLELLPWSGNQEYRDSDRVVWRVSPSDKDVAGWVRSAKNLQFVVVHDAGHIVPYDNAKAASDMITRMIEAIPYHNRPNPKLAPVRGGAVLTDAVGSR